MDYTVSPFGVIWNEGIFNIPNKVFDKYIKLAGEYQLKALLYILRNGGQASSKDIAKALGQTQSDIEAIMEFWVEEGVLADSQIKAASPAHLPTDEQPKENTKEKKPAAKKLEIPRLTPKDVAVCIRESKDISALLSDAQQVLGRTISHAEQELLINMINYYGLPVEVILMILEFYRCEKAKGKSIGIGFINSMAKNWSDEGIVTIEAAEEKLKDLERSDRLWNEIIAITGISHKRPTAKQREMVKSWFDSFDFVMINLAADIMKENIPAPRLAYMDSILKKWKSNGITTPEQVRAQQEQFEKQKQSSAKKDGEKLQGKATYDIDEISKKAMENTDIV